MPPPQEHVIPTGPVVAWAVLDTNVALDWLLWSDPSTAALAQAIRRGVLGWAWTAPMRDELRHVLAHRLTTFDAPRRDDALAEATRHAVEWPVPTPLVLPGLQCRDPDDRPFVDLAIALPARWLFSRDKAVLALAPAASMRGLQVARPSDVDLSGLAHQAARLATRTASA